MIKGRKILFASLSMVIVLAIAGFARAYDFTDALPHTAYEGYDNNSPVDSPPDFEQLLNGGNYSQIAASDNSRAWYSQDSFYEFHRFKFSINENVTTISQFSVLHEGYASSLPGAPGHRLYIWNYTSSGWEFVNGTNVMDTDQVLTGTFNVSRQVNLDNM